MVPEAAAIVADLGRDLRRLAEDILNRLALEPAFGDARVEIAGIGRVMLVVRSEEHTSELQSLMRISYAVFCLTKKNTTHIKINTYVKKTYHNTSNVSTQ